MNEIEIKILLDEWNRNKDITCHCISDPPYWIAYTPDKFWMIKNDDKILDYVWLAKKYTDWFLDLFWWSGSDLIACENKWRKCFMMELDEKYIQVIIKRYYNYTDWQKEIKCLNRELDLKEILNQ